jgi:hypothetical protein
MAGLTLFLSVGLFVGGCHEFEEVWGETREVWSVNNEFFSSSKFPFVLLKPFGYTSTRTVLQITTFWLWLALGLLLHYIKWDKTKKVRAMYPDESESIKEVTEPTKDSNVVEPTSVPEPPPENGKAVDSGTSSDGGDEEAA